jgi:hypothetical protein
MPIRAEDRLLRVRPGLSTSLPALPTLTALFRGAAPYFQ